MTETPLVIVDTMRGGPSTGLPTKQEQSDLMQMIYGTHGEIPKIILAPADVEDAFYLTTEAFNLADKYQAPVILLSDLQMSLGKQSANPFDLSKVEIDRGQIITEDIENDGAYFERFKLTESGISDRPIPGVKGGIHHVTGVEHNPNGTPNESAVNRKEQMDKRMRKVKELSIDTPFKVNGEEESDLLVISFLSGNGAVDEAVERVGGNITTIHMRQLFPVPIEALRPYLDGAKKVLVVEQNYTGQLFNVLKMNYHDHNKMESFSKYDGTPLKPMEIERHIKQFM